MDVHKKGGCMKRKSYRICSILLCVLTFGWATCVQADEAAVEGDDASTQESSVYQNQAQVAHAKNLTDVAVENDEDVLASRQSVIDAEKNVVEAENSGVEAEIIAAKVQLDAAEEDYAKTVSEVTGIHEDQIMELRTSGMGWGDIAHELGVHPGALGLGHTKNKSGALNTEREIAMATVMDLSSGKTKGHGFGNDTDFSGSAKDNRGKSEKDSSKDKGGQGNKGGNGNGNGNGNDKGNGKNK